MQYITLVAGFWIMIVGQAGRRAMGEQPAGAGAAAAPAPGASASDRGRGGGWGGTG
jgi:hypothetical protein